MVVVLVDRRGGTEGMKERRMEREMIEKKKEEMEFVLHYLVQDCFPGIE